MRYGPQFSQHLSASDLSGVSKFCTYEGEAPDLAHLRGLLIETVRAEELVYVGERENIYAETRDGHRIRPWMGCWITEFDAAGNVVTTGYAEGKKVVRPKVGPDAMTLAELNGLGFTENELVELAQKHLGETYVPEEHDPSDRRRAFFNRVCAKLYAP